MSITLYTGDVPLRDGSQTNEQFSTNVGDLLTWIPPMTEEFNTELANVNESLLEIEGIAADAEASAAAAAVSESEATTQAGISTTQAGIAVAAAASATLAPGTSATSTSTLTPGYGSKSFTLAEVGKTFVVGQFVTVADSADPGNKYFNGPITAFTSGTVAITVDSRAFAGMTSSSSWVVTGSAPAFGQRFTNPTQSFVALGTVSGTVNLDLRVTMSFILTIGGNTNFTVTLPDGYGATDQIGCELDITMGGTLYTIGYPAGTDFHEGANPITAINTRDVIGFVKKGNADAVVGRLRRAIS